MLLFGLRSHTSKHCCVYRYIASCPCSSQVAHYLPCVPVLPGCRLLREHYGVSREQGIRTPWCTCHLQAQLQGMSQASAALLCQAMPATFGKSCDCSRLDTALDLDDMTAARALQYVVGCRCLPALPLCTVCMLYLCVSMQHIAHQIVITLVQQRVGLQQRLRRKSTSGCHPANHKSGF